jgi:hypothetical protein
MDGPDECCAGGVFEAEGTEAGFVDCASGFVTGVTDEAEFDD